MYTPHKWWFILTTVAVSVVILALFKALRNISAAPFLCVIDEPKEYFDVPTMFKKRVRDSAMRSNFQISGQNPVEKFLVDSGDL